MPNTDITITEGNCFLADVNPFDMTSMQKAEMKTSRAPTYPQQRPLLNMTSNQRILGQFFGEDKLQQSLPEMPAVPVKNALTLEDIERV